MILTQRHSRDRSIGLWVNNFTDCQRHLILRQDCRGLFPTHGNYSVALDGNYQSNASATGSNVSNSTLWESYSLGYGTHVVEIADQLSDLNYVSYLDIKSVQIERNIGQKK